MILEIVMSASRFAALRMACLAVGFAVTAGAPVQAQQQPPGAQGHIVVIGEGSVSAVPDYAQTIGGVTTQGKSVQEATAANSKIMAAITAALVDAGVAQKDIQTSRFWVQPQYNTSSPAKISGYEVSNQVTVKIRDLNKAGDIIERIVGAGATNVGNIQFQHNDPSKLLDQAREAAVADAKRKAEVYAKASGVTLGRVAWLTEDAGYTPPMPMLGARAAAGASSPVPISTGEDALHVRITVGFDIAN
jgi:uncharacterized protein YggE